MNTECIWICSFSGILEQMSNYAAPIKKNKPFGNSSHTIPIESQVMNARYPVVEE